MTTMTSFEELMGIYYQLPDGPDLPDSPDLLDCYLEDEILNGVGFFRGYLWQEAERRLGEDIEEFPLIVEALTCAAVFARESAEALRYVEEHVDDAERDSPVYRPEIVEALVWTAEQLPKFVDITPPAAALENVRVPNMYIMDEIIPYGEEDDLAAQPVAPVEVIK